MKLFIDRKARKFLKSAASNVALERLVLKRRDLVPLEYVFVENGQVVTASTGTTITCAIKRKFTDANFLALASGTPPTLNLNTIPIEAAFATAEAVLAVFLEIRWEAPGETIRTAILKADLQNSVILGNEGTPELMESGKATQSAAEDPTNDAAWMTPMRTFQAIEAAKIVYQFPTFSDFPVNGRLNRLYMAEDDGTIYRWTGTVYAQTPGTVDAGTF
jgi:hypothetical protein